MAGAVNGPQYGHVANRQAAVWPKYIIVYKILKLRADNEVATFCV